MRSLLRRLLGVALTFCVLVVASASADAEQAEIRIARGFGITVLPIMLMENMKLIEKHAR